MIVDLERAPDDPAGWAASHRTRLRGLVARHGTVLVRGLGLADAVGVEGVFRSLSDTLMPDLEGFGARTAYADGVHSSTPWPANQPMCLHHEMSYRAEFPSLMLFACLRAPTSGGAIAVADAAEILAALPPELVAPFARHGWELARSYHDDIGAPWQTAFGTGDPAAVEAYARPRGISLHWSADGGLRTVQRAPAVVRHPADGRWCWFNQIAFLHDSTMAPEVREYLVELYGEDGLPFTTRCGDGSPVPAATIELITEVYDAHTRREPWDEGDLLLVDNIGTAHRRDAYTGLREVVVGLADPVPRAAVLGGAPGPTG